MNDCKNFEAQRYQAISIEKQGKDNWEIQSITGKLFWLFGELKTCFFPFPFFKNGK
jgi:hypothetical protein